MSCRHLPFSPHCQRLRPDLGPVPEDLAECVVCSAARRAALDRIAAVVAQGIRVDDTSAAELAKCLDVPTPPALRNRVLSSVKDRPRLLHFVGRVARLLDVPPAKALEYLALVDAHERWEATPFEGVTRLPVEGGPKTAGAVTHIVRVVPGKTIPKHVHFGPETALMLQGRGLGDDGRVTQPGDLGTVERGTSHSIEGLPVVDCVMLVVAFAGVSFGDFQLLPTR